MKLWSLGLGCAGLQPRAGWAGPIRAPTQDEMGLLLGTVPGTGRSCWKHSLGQSEPPRPSRDTNPFGYRKLTKVGLGLPTSRPNQYPPPPGLTLHSRRNLVYTYTGIILSCFMQRWKYNNSFFHAEYISAKKFMYIKFIQVMFKSFSI